jgi:hypothetical protein
MAKKTTLEEIGEMLTHVASTWQRRTTLPICAVTWRRRSLRGQINSIERQLRDAKTEVRLGALEDKVFGAPRR